MQDWQHAAMYGAFLASGLIDLLGHYCPKGTLPPGLEHVRPQYYSFPVCHLHAYARARASQHTLIPPCWLRPRQRVLIPGSQHKRARITLTQSAAELPYLP